MLPNTVGGPVAATVFDPGGVLRVTEIIPVQPVPVTGLNGPVGEPVTRPLYANAGQLMCAIAASSNEVFGLFVDEVNSPRYHWELIASIPPGELIAGLCSFDGTVIFAGTTNAKIYQINPVTKYAQ